MKKQRLNLERLHVKSFVTKMAEATSETVKGGGSRIGNCYSGGCQYPSRNYEASCEVPTTSTLPPEEVSFYC